MRASLGDYVFDFGCVEFYSLGYEIGEGCVSHRAALTSTLKGNPHLGPVDTDQRNIAAVRLEGRPDLLDGKSHPIFNCSLWPGH